MDSDYLQEVRSFINTHVGDAGLGDDDDIFATGAVSSLFAVQLVIWVERRFDIPVAPADLDIANFRTMTDTARFVEARVSRSAARLAEDTESRRHA